MGDETVPGFIEWPKIPRLKSSRMVITEKLDGTNAQVFIREDGEIFAGSRTRWLSEHEDNFGFHRFVQEHSDAFRQLGYGRHFGEFWGPGIQRGYGLKHRVFSLFNVDRWYEVSREWDDPHVQLVPKLYEGPWSEVAIEGVLVNLTRSGSWASPGFMRPEGIVIYHSAGRVLFKRTFEEGHKGGTNKQTVTDRC